MAALLARKPNLSRIEARFGLPRIDNFALAADSLEWRMTHA
jgi:hypothetical protein